MITFLPWLMAAGAFGWLVSTMIRSAGERRPIAVRQRTADAHHARRFDARDAR